MALPSFASETVTVLRAPLVDSRGTKERDWANAESHEVAGCNVQPSSTSTGRTDPRESVSFDAVLYAPEGADIKPADRVSCSLGTFSVDGEPQDWESPTGALSHLEANLSKWEG